MTALLFGPRPTLRYTKPVWVILSGCIILPAFQLIPLPPIMWQALPGRALFSQAAIIAGEPQPWRPIALVPGATINALGSLLVPLATLLLLTQLKDEERRYVPAILLSIITASMLIGLMQFAGLNIASPFGDRGPVDVSGFFDNRNHFALLLAIGCALAPVWAALSKRQHRLRMSVAVGLALLFTLCILASGSRAGILGGFLGLFFGALIARHIFLRALSGYTRWKVWAIFGVLTAIIVAILLLSVFTNRAVSINRFLLNDATQDMRSRTLPTIIDMIGTYFPAGTGYGSFDPIFRIHESLDLLSPNYFNHAHNDFLETILDGGIAGLMLLAIGALWWCVATYRAYRSGDAHQNGLARLGSSIILLVTVASAVDYPARTPLMMAIVTIAAIWLAAAKAVRGPALPATSRLL
ncbi:MAG: O-antigen ligase family protein [Pseudomonadota bacterium]